MREETIGKQKLILGDCLEIMPTMENGSLDAVITDPPYGVDVAPWDIAPSKEFVDNCLRIAIGPVLMFGAAPIRSQQQFLLLEPDRMLVWAPSFSLAKTNSNGIFYRYHPIWCWRLPKSQNAISFDVLKESCDGHNWWNHPCTKPLSLMRRLVGIIPIGSSLIDPFFGSGSTLVSAELIGMNGIGIEINPLYFDIACHRVEEATKQQRMEFEPPKHVDIPLMEE